MNNETRIEEMKTRLNAVLEPVRLEISDESHLHVGHAGAKSGKGHFHVKITAESFRNLKAIQQHRLIYAALGDLMETEIHALSIEAEAP